MIYWIIDILSWLLIGAGSILMMIGGLGLMRLPDLYTRLHSASITDTGATILLVLGMLLQAVFAFGDPMAAIKVCLILFFTLFTAPTASHALAKTALLGGLVPTDKHGKPLFASSVHARQFGDSSLADPEHHDLYADLIEHTPRLEIHGRDSEPGGDDSAAEQGSDTQSVDRSQTGAERGGAERGDGEGPDGTDGSNASDNPGRERS